MKRGSLCFTTKQQKSVEIYITVILHISWISFSQNFIEGLGSRFVACIHVYRDKMAEFNDL